MASPTATIFEVPVNVGTKEEQEAAPAEQYPTTDFGFIPIPRRLRYQPEKPFHFGLLMNISFGFASTFMVANLFYCQPLLIQFSDSFGVSYEKVSTIPTLTQAGYALGLLLISPLGDLVRRRQLIIALVFMCMLLTVGIAVTTNLIAFQALCFLAAIVTVVPQILMPLTADLAPPERRASALAVVLSGLLLGILLGRVLAGVIGNFTSWRVVYYMSVGVQGVVFVGAYLLLPDYPAKNKNLTYFDILYTMAKFVVTEPQLVQGMLINFASSACFTAFWVTLTFLLGGPPYYYSTLVTLVIGLFGLVGMLGVMTAPFTGRFVDRLVPWYGVLIASCGMLVFSAIQTGAGAVSIGAVVIVCFGLDVFRQTQQVSVATNVFSIDASARSRLNAVLILSTFTGQVAGTSAGTTVFLQYGWRALGGFMMALCGFMILILFVRGPHVSRYRWVGYQGGFESRKSVIDERKKKEKEKRDLEAGNNASRNENESEKSPEATAPEEGRPEEVEMPEVQEVGYAMQGDSESERGNP
ncbi:MFS general substrate transporter [Coniophora puteana RWD-64-598 SS2]|uniref:MFS general substrate transporter n=1 Tax=Coniophora puteana (strain RWD-64-598) TaxID=741705 RepID=R7SEF5_CONPW|nr:MFS general substrate transporter [Coniophora puteana RWD-64-598 SS2]EIW74210.1 MFS general substrate transporter [Coniophora puteana RWD-64-598 SS2]